MLPELPTFAQFFLKEEEYVVLGEVDSGLPCEVERIELFFLFFPEPWLMLLLLLLAPPLPPPIELGRTGVKEPEEISLGLKNDDVDLVVLLLEERDLSARPEAREGAEEEEEDDEDEWAEGICGDEDTCRACVMP